MARAHKEMGGGSVGDALPGDAPPIDGAAGWVLFLDLDGTLLEFAAQPSAVTVDARLPGLLDRLQESLGGALVLVGGRPVADMDRLLAPLRLPMAGVHGLERRDAQGKLSRQSAPGIPASIRNVFRKFANARTGVLFEDKGGSVALHYREAPECGDAARDLVRASASAHDGFDILDGKMVVELRPSGINKGCAIAAFMGEIPFAARCPVFVGDDATDEDGFMTVNAMGGLSIRVTDADNWRNDTCARFRLADVAAVHAWLSAVETATGKEGPAAGKGKPTCTA